MQTTALDQNVKINRSNVRDPLTFILYIHVLIFFRFDRINAKV